MLDNTIEKGQLPMEKCALSITRFIRTKNAKRSSMRLLLLSSKTTEFAINQILKSSKPLSTAVIWPTKLARSELRSKCKGVKLDLLTKRKSERSILCRTASALG